MNSSKIAAVLCVLAMAFTTFGASAGYWDHDRGPGYGRRPGYPGHPGNPGHPGYPGHPGHPENPGYYPSWQWSGQKAGPIHGSPWGVNYCGTENPGYCQPYQRGQECYINSGYWWDNSRQVNWFNVYQCR